MVLRYAVLQLPGFAAAAAVLWLLVYWELLGTGVAGLLLALWVAKDVLMFPVVRVAYEPGPPHGAEALIGALGTARDALSGDATGYVRVGAELWRARLAAGREQPVAAGDAVRVVGAQGLTLAVERVEP